VYASLDLNWQPGASASPPRGKAPAILRDDPYTHTIRVTGGWGALGAEQFAAQLRRRRLSSGAADDPVEEFTVDVEQDDDDLLIVLALTAAQTVALPVTGYWDLQQVDGPTLLAGTFKVLDDVTRSA
jgi:hypothetical protein